MSLLLPLLLPTTCYRMYKSMVLAVLGEFHTRIHGVGCGDNTMNSIAVRSNKRGKGVDVPCCEVSTLLQANQT